jgi:hypothetical protein
LPRRGGVAFLGLRMKILFVGGFLQVEKFCEQIFIADQGQWQAECGESSAGDLPND